MQWSNIESTAKSSIQEKKIRVNFLPADGSSSAGAGVASTPVRHSTSSEHPPAYSSPSASTPQSYAPGAVSTPDSRPVGARNLGDAKASAYGAQSNGGQQSTLSNAANSVASVIPMSMEDLKAQLAEAQATISNLAAQAQDSVLRQRKTDPSASGNTQTTTYNASASQPSGVPVPIVASLCLLSFLLAYLLF